MFYKNVIAGSRRVAVLEAQEDAASRWKRNTAYDSDTPFSIRPTQDGLVDIDGDAIPKDELGLFSYRVAKTSINAAEPTPAEYALMEYSGAAPSGIDTDRRFDQILNADTTITAAQVTASNETYGVSVQAPGVTVTLDELSGFTEQAELEVSNVSGGSIFVVGGTIDGDPTGIELNGNGMVTLERMGGVWILAETASAATGSGGGAGSSYTGTGGLELVGAVFQEVPYQNLPSA